MEAWSINTIFNCVDLEWHRIQIKENCLYWEIEFTISSKKVAEEDKFISQNQNSILNSL